MRLLSRKSVTIQPHHPRTLIDGAISRLKYELTSVQSITPGVSGRSFPSRLVAVCGFPAEGVEVPRKPFSRNQCLALGVPRAQWLQRFPSAPSFGGYFSRGLQYCQFPIPIRQKYDAPHQKTSVYTSLDLHHPVKPPPSHSGI